MLEQEELAAQYAEYCKDVLAWVQAGCPVENQHAFYKEVGLCSNLSDWAPSYTADALVEYQLELFRDAGLDATWPFDGSSVEYRTSRTRAGLYGNTRRLKWLQDHAAQ